MSEDVIEFGPAGEPEGRQSRRRSPRRPIGSAIPTAAAGAVAAIASLVGPWQSTTVPYDDNGSRKIGSALAALGPVGAAYVMVLTALVATVVIVLFGRPELRSTTRLIGYALAGCGLAIVASIGYAFSKTSNLADFRLYPAEDLSNVDFTLEWGIYVAAASVLAFASALALSSSVAQRVMVASEPEFEEPREMELEVSVHPANPAAAPGAAHQLYLGP